MITKNEFDSILNCYHVRDGNFGMGFSWYDFFFFGGLILRLGFA